MAYGRRTVKRYTRRYSKYAKPSKTIPIKDYVLCNVGFTTPIIDSSNSVIDIMSVLLTTSADWLTIKNNYSVFKVTKVIIDFSPFLTAPISASDSANGFVCIRDGYWVYPHVTLTTNELAKFPNVCPFNNCRPFTLSRTVTSGTWFHGNATSSETSDMPKLFFYIGLTSQATTNSQRGSVRCRVFMIAKGSQIE